MWPVVYSSSTRVFVTHPGRGYSSALGDHLPGAGHRANDTKEQSRGHKEQTEITVEKRPTVLVLRPCG